MALWDIAVTAPLFDLLTYQVPDHINLKQGSVVEVPLGKRKAVGICIKKKTTTLNSELEIKEVIRILYDGWALPEDYLRWLLWISEYYIYPPGLTLELSLPPASRLKSHPKKYPSDRSIPYQKIELNSYQKEIFEKIGSHPFFEVHMLHGVTGSGKTEIYLELFDHFLKQEGQGLFLLPEISLTPQMLNRFSARFPHQIAILHSQLTPAQKNYEWQRVQNKSAKILIGARSALFCPIPELKLIVLDEEHDPSFKQDSKLRYHARSAAIMLAKNKNIPIVLGSATPSLESWYQVKKKKYTYHQLNYRAKTQTTAKIELIDMRQKDPGSKLPSWLSQRLFNEMKYSLNRDEQVALFLNRRGTASIVFCDSCGFHYGCPNCDIALTLHQQKMLVCHYCNYQQLLGNKCSSCHEGTPKPYGLGTEQIETDLISLFPSARIVRIDRDEIQSVTHLEEIIQSIEKREVDILIGTQMIAKGFDFPSLKLVGFVLADIGLQLPDFRAQERACQLLFQMAGRSGRHSLGEDDAGKVLIQTYNPDNFVFTKVIENLYTSFMDEELERRSELNYPPSGRMVLFHLESKTQKTAERAALKLRELLLFATRRYRESSGLQVLGPTPATISKIRNQFRYHLIVKSDLEIPISKISRWAFLELNKLKLRVTTHVDVDPQHLL
jgi:primosomal protein N' (replication factor Y)